MGKPDPRNIGLLGGSFNPAHAGHLHISLEAIRLLGLDEVWWLVSPQNPLKPTEGMAAFRDRMDSAREITKNHANIKISDFEKKAGTVYTSDTVNALRHAYPANSFIWLMGADNIVNFHQWHKWQEIFTEIKIAVFDRGEYKSDALKSKAALYFKDYQFPPEQLAKSRPPAWCFAEIEKHPASSTKIREGGESASY